MTNWPIDNIETEEELNIGALVRWYDYYDDGIVSNWGSGIVLQTRVYEYNPAYNLYSVDGTIGFPDMYDRAKGACHRHTQYLVYKTALLTTEWLPREWLAPLHACIKKNKKKKENNCR